MKRIKQMRVWSTFAALALLVGLGLYGTTLLPPWIMDVVCSSDFVLGFDTCLALILIFVAARLLCPD